MNCHVNSSQAAERVVVHRRRAASGNYPAAAVVIVLLVGAAFASGAQAGVGARRASAHGLPASGRHAPRSSKRQRSVARRHSRRAAALAPSPVGVPLGSADSFAVLAGSTVTNTGPSVITGDLGVSPGTAVTGFPPGTVTSGTIHSADGAALQAQSDLATAYQDAAGRNSSATISADLAGRTLTPGVYTSASSLGLSGDLTLDAQGDPSAVFVFQAGSTLTVGSGSRVFLTGGAQACNVFWQVGSSASIGAQSAFAGNILALTSISMTTGATLYGRALARNGAVSLDTNVITRAQCTPQTSAPPSVTNTSATTGEGQPVNVVLHGTDSTSAPLTYVITSSSSHGALGPIDQAAGTVTYTPGPGFSGADSFTYEATSVNGTSTPATATITVTPSGTGVGSGTTPAPAGIPGTGGTGGGTAPAPAGTPGSDVTQSAGVPGDSGSSGTTAHPKPKKRRPHHRRPSVRPLPATRKPAAFTG